MAAGIFLHSKEISASARISTPFCLIVCSSCICPFSIMIKHCFLLGSLFKRWLLRQFSCERQWGNKPWEICWFHLFTEDYIGNLDSRCSGETVLITGLFVVGRKQGKGTEILLKYRRGMWAKDVTRTTAEHLTLYEMLQLLSQKRCLTTQTGFWICGLACPSPLQHCCPPPWRTQNCQNNKNN